MFSTLTFSLTAFALFGFSAAADLEIISPGGSDLWWVAQSSNTLLWNCAESPYSNFTVLLGNSNAGILAAPIAVIAVEENYECSKTITQDQANFTAATGYTILLANTLNNTDVYATSQPFEIKALGSTYPASSATPMNAASATSAPSGTGTGSSSSSSASATTSSTSSKSGAVASTFVGTWTAGLLVMAMMGLITL